MMQKRIIFPILSGIGFIIVMVSGYGFFGQGWGIGATLIISLVCWLGLKYRQPILIHISLTGGITLSVYGTASGIPFFYMFLAGVFSLITWDLLLFSLEHSRFPDEKAGSPLEKKHLEILVIAVTASLVAAVPLVIIKIHIPFLVMLFLVLLAGLGIERVWGVLKRRKNRMS